MGLHYYLQIHWHVGLTTKEHPLSLFITDSVVSARITRGCQDCFGYFYPSFVKQTIFRRVFKCNESDY